MNLNFFCKGCKVKKGLEDGFFICEFCGDSFCVVDCLKVIQSIDNFNKVRFEDKSIIGSANYLNNSERVIDNLKTDYLNKSQGDLSMNCCAIYLNKYICVFCNEIIEKKKQK